MTLPASLMKGDGSPETGTVTFRRSVVLSSDTEDKSITFDTVTS